MVINRRGTAVEGRAHDAICLFVPAEMRHQAWTSDTCVGGSYVS